MNSKQNCKEWSYSFPIPEYEIWAVKNEPELFNELCLLRKKEQLLELQLMNKCHLHKELFGEQQTKG